MRQLEEVNVEVRDAMVAGEPTQLAFGRAYAFLSDVRRVADHCIVMRCVLDSPGSVLRPSTRISKGHSTPDAPGDPGKSLKRGKSLTMSRTDHLRVGVCADAQVISSANASRGTKGKGVRSAIDGKRIADAEMVLQFGNRRADAALHRSPRGSNCHGIDVRTANTMRSDVSLKAATDRCGQYADDLDQKRAFADSGVVNPQREDLVRGLIDKQWRKREFDHGSRHVGRRVHYAELGHRHDKSDFVYL